MGAGLATVGRVCRPSRRLGFWSLPERPAVMAVVNLTPDSFSDGGRVGPAELRGRLEELAAAGADLLDIGAESTRPGAGDVSADEQCRRLDPLFGCLGDIPLPVSIDTRSARVASLALSAGAEIINDVSAGRADAAMAAVVARSGGVLIAMHMRGTPATMDEFARYDDIRAEVLGEWTEARDSLAAGGMAAADVWFDPGIGFAKTADQNWRLLRTIVASRPVEVPVVVGASRKRFLAFGESDPRRRDAASVALAGLLAAGGVDVLRMHDVAGARRAVDVAMCMGEGAAA